MLVDVSDAGSRREAGNKIGRDRRRRASHGHLGLQLSEFFLLVVFGGGLGLGLSLD